MIEHPDFDECQGVFEPVRQGLVGSAGFRLPAGVVMGEYEGGRVMGKSFLHHFPGMNDAAVDGPEKKLFKSEGPVAVVEEEGGEYFALFSGQLGDEVALGIFRASEGFLSEEPSLELLADEFEHLIDCYRPDDAVFARAFGRLESCGVVWRDRFFR